MSRTKRSLHVGKMDKYLREKIQDEDLFFLWLEVVPDEATADDFDDIGSDTDDYNLVCRLFSKIVIMDLET